VIHETAIVHHSAKIADSATIGPFCVLGENVIIGDNTELISHVTIGKNAILGKKNRIFQFASIGSEPIDYSYKSDQFSQVIIGDNNVIRECATIHGGTSKETGITTIGNNNLIMCYVHVGHDCQIGNNIMFVNNVGLAGHVRVHDYAIISTSVGVHQFVRIGSFSFIAHGAMVGRDVPPFVMITGNTGTTSGASPKGINSEGLKRANFTPEQIKAVKSCYRVLYRQGLILKDAITKIKEMAKEEEVLEIMVDFLRCSEKRGITR